MEHKLFASLVLVLILTMGINVLHPMFGLQLLDDSKYYSEECDSLTEKELSKLDLTKPDPC